MNLLVDAPAYWPSEDAARSKAWLYLASAAHFGASPHLYGVGSTYYHGEVPMRLDGQIEFLTQHKADYTHVLFSDAWDVIFTAPLDEIVYKYKKFGSPECLIGGAIQNLNAHPDNLYDEFFDMTQPYPYATTAMYIAEIPYIIDRFTRMNKACTHDQTPAFIEAWMEGWFHPEIDYKCELFQDKEDNCILHEGRVHNTLTDTYPSMLHVSGDFMDPATGRDHRIIPWAKGVGILPDDYIHVYGDK